MIAHKSDLHPFQHLKENQGQAPLNEIKKNGAPCMRKYNEFYLKHIVFVI